MVAGSILVSYFSFSYIAFPVRAKEVAMEPGIKQGDLIFVNRWKLGIKKPFLYDGPHAFFYFKQPKLGDVVALQSPYKQPASLFLRVADFPVYLLSLGLYKLNTRDIILRRVIGLPGDKIMVKDKSVYINDLLFVPDWPALSKDTRVLPAFLSTRDVLDETVIPRGYVFVLSDYWDILADSRSFGLVPMEKLEGVLFE